MDGWAAFSQNGLDVEYSLVEGRYHYMIARNGTEKLYDFIADPAETHDISSDPNNEVVIRAFRDELERVVGSVAPERYRRVMSGAKELRSE